MSSLTRRFLQSPSISWERMTHGHGCLSLNQHNIAPKGLGTVQTFPPPTLESPANSANPREIASQTLTEFLTHQSVFEHRPQFNANRRIERFDTVCTHDTEGMPLQSMLP